MTRCSNPRPTTRIAPRMASRIAPRIGCTLAVLAAAAGVCSGVPGTDDREDRPTTTAVERAQFDTVDDLLTAVEARDREIHTLRGMIRHTTVNTLANDTQSRDGELFLETDWDDVVKGEPNRKFAIRFDTFRAGNVVRDELRWFVFDGEWVIEVLPKEKEFNKWQVVPPGARLDPFEDPGNTPFWLPMGREKDRIERIAETEMLAPTEWLEGEEMPSSLAEFVTRSNTVQLRLIPREGTKFAEKWDDVRIWFSRDTLLPVLYVAVDPSGDQRIAQLFRVQTNVDMDPKTFVTTSPDPESGWNVTVQQYRGDSDG
ncbi:MAG: hypothetical protein R3B49_06215 [Phycisphaerales bacterium]